ncbi:MAG: hypothetical protein ACYS9C_13155 [Planctomycetota bacterium]|jgi:hypothetical protein
MYQTTSGAGRTLAQVLSEPWLPRLDGAFWALKLADTTIFTTEADSTGLTGEC